MCVLSEWNQVTYDRVVSVLEESRDQRARMDINGSRDVPVTEDHVRHVISCCTFCLREAGITMRRIRLLGRELGTNSTEI